MIKLLNAIVIVFVLTGCSPSTPQLPALSGDSVILSFGDSLTYGTGVGDDDAYPAVLERLTGLSVVNAGVPGEETPQGLKRLPQLLNEYKPALLVLCHGGNDILRKRDKNAAAENLKSMIRMARERNISVILLGVPDFGLFLSVADFYVKVAEEMQVPFDPDTLPDILSDNDLKSDQIHPNARGYHIMAEAVVKLMQKSGAIK